MKRRKWSQFLFTKFTLSLCCSKALCLTVSMADEPGTSAGKNPAGEPPSDDDEYDDLLPRDDDELDESEAAVDDQTPWIEESVDSGLSFENLPPMDERVRYVMLVKNVLGENSTQFYCFNHLVQEYVRQRIGVIQFRPRARALLKEHAGLVMGLNVFLPEGFKIPVTSPEEDKYQGVKDFINTVKKRYEHDSQRYDRLSDVLTERREKKISYSEARAEVCNILCDSPDLIREFRLSLSYMLKTFKTN